MIKKKASHSIQYDADSEVIARFLVDFIDNEGNLCYLDQLEAISTSQRKVLEIRLDDLNGFEPDSLILEKFQSNSWRYLTLVEKVADDIIKRKFPDALEMSVDEENAEEVLRRQRVDEQRKIEALASELGMSEGNGMPAELTRNFEVLFKPLSKEKPQSLRDVKASQIGRFVNIRGIVTRVGEVLPRILVACYLCEECGYEVYQPVNGRDFMPLSTCPSPKCKQDKKVGNLYLRPKYSKFVKYQELRIQELPDQVPIGNVPRSLVVEARGESTRRCTAGDIVEISGVFLPEKQRQTTQRHQMAASLISSTYLRCMDVKREKHETTGFSALDEEELQTLVQKEVSMGRSMYERLASSIAPEIWGHEDVKKAILLQLVGGVHNKTQDGMKIRGDINIALFGDPGVAKSQLLKHVAKVAPRCVYTTGRGSSGVGLTAAVTKDSFTGEVALEGGALVLADKGICCIDEFDKMDDTDRTAIHEVMEQQTVSIAKAGITTTLNARTAVLAAANPLYGRYNRKISPTENINLPAALLSRFDLLFLLLDKPSSERDRALAEHVTYVHMHKSHPARELEPLDSNQLRAYISHCKQVNPGIPDSESADPDERERARRLVAHITEAYVDMRQQDASDAENNHAKSALTPRHLLSMLRLASAHARLRLGHEIQEEDIDEAIRLVRASKLSLEDDETLEQERIRDDPISKVFRIVSDLLKSRMDENERNPTVSFAEVEERVLRRGFSSDMLKRTLQEYSREDVGILYVGTNGNSIRFTDVE